MTTRWSAAVARVRAHANVVIARPSTIVTHLVTVAERPCHDGVIRYDYACSCGNAVGTRDTDADARQAAKVHEPHVTFAERSRMPFQIVATNPRKVTP